MSIVNPCRAEACTIARVHETHELRSKVNTATVDNETFIKEWWEASSYEDLAKRTGMKYWAMVTRAKELRKRGHHLNPMRRREGPRPRCFDCKRFTNAGPCPGCGKVFCLTCAEKPYAFCCEGRDS